jgi:hypothetical protein
MTAPSPYMRRPATQPIRDTLRTTRHCTACGCALQTLYSHPTPGPFTTVRLGFQNPTDPAWTQRCEVCEDRLTRQQFPPV